MSLAGQVLCQRMLIGPWALAMLGAATVAAAPAAATFRKRRRVEVLSLIDVMWSSPVRPILAGRPLLGARQRRAPRFGKNVRGAATLRRGVWLRSNPWPGGREA